MSNKFRRVVTGHDDKAAPSFNPILAPERVRTLAGAGGPTFYEIWNTRETPARIDRASGEPAEDGIMLTPPAGGTRIRVLDIPPETTETANLDAAKARAHFAEIGAENASTNTGDAVIPTCIAHRPSITGLCSRAKSRFWSILARSRFVRATSWCSEGPIMDGRTVPRRTAGSPSSSSTANSWMVFSYPRQLAWGVAGCALAYPLIHATVRSRPPKG